MPVLGNNLLIAQKPLRNKDQFIQRVDFNESSSSSMVWALQLGRRGAEAAGAVRERRKILTHVWQAMISNTRVLSPTKVNEFRFGAN